MNDIYTPTYCMQLEAAYGSGMMSEGGEDGIEHMFDGISLNKKKALDVGSGLGGVVFYLAEKHGMHVTGLEINPWMVKESEKRTPDLLKEKVEFLLSLDNGGWPSSSESYDLIYSKGVLTHVESKDEVFQQCLRLLKKGGYLVITDWLSAKEKKWGENIERLVELENLALFPESEDSYVHLLKNSGFKFISALDDSLAYLGYNQDIVKRLQNLSLSQNSCFNEIELDASISGYESIAKAIEVGELRVLRFVVQKN